MVNNLDFFPVKPIGTKRKKFGKCKGNLRLARALRSSSTPPGFFYFRRTNDVRSFVACFNIGDVLHAQAGFGQTRSPVMGYWSDRIKTSQKEAFPLVEVELKRPDENSSLFQAFRQWSATRRKEREKNIRRKKTERERGGNAQFPRSHPTPPPRCFFFCSHLFAQSP